MNFFEQQERARKHTRHMLMLFIVAVAAIVFAVDLVLVIAMNSGGGRHSRHGRCRGAHTAHRRAAATGR